MALRRDGFTLVEMVVVIVVLVLALFFVYLIANRGIIRGVPARNILCKTNLKGYGYAFMTYLDDNDQLFPDAEQWLFRNFDPNNDGCRWHDKSRNLNNRPQDAGVFWQYVANKDNHLCPTFDKLAVSGLGRYHRRHDPMITMDPQYSYSMNGYLGPGRYGMVKKLEQLEQAPARVLSFTEQNIMWNIHGKNRPHSDLNTFMFLSRTKPYQPQDYVDTFATYHRAPSEDIEIDEDGYATSRGSEYSKWGLCQGVGNAVFLDLHVEAMPYTVDDYDYSWPLKRQKEEFTPYILKK